MKRLTKSRGKNNFNYLMFNDMNTNIIKTVLGLSACMFFCISCSKSGDSGGGGNSTSGQGGSMARFPSRKTSYISLITGR
jgi:hypothetical protein